MRTEFSAVYTDTSTMLIHDPAVENCAAVRLIGIAIRPFSLEQNHLGILYLTPEGRAKVFHHQTDRTCSVDPEDKYFWVDLGVGFEEMDRQYIHAEVRRIAERNENQPTAYGFDAPAPVYDEQGALKEEFANFGYTCASLVLNVFESRGYRLLQYEQWPQAIGHDRDWQEAILRQICYADPEQLARQQDLIGSRRFLPQEVLAACLLEIPGEYPQVSHYGRQVNHELALKKGWASS